MITQEPTAEILEEWKFIWLKYKDNLKPNRKTGAELLDYLQNNYVLTEIFDKKALEAITGNVTMNVPYAEKLPEGVSPIPRAFYLGNVGKGERFYLPNNIDTIDLWDGEISKIFVGIDVASGFYMVEGSTMLWDELCAYQGVDDKDLQNYVCVAQYIKSSQRLGKQ